MDGFQQLSIVDLIYDKKKITKKLRLIELFAGVGAQAKSLEALGVDFEHYRICEWAYNSYCSYNAIHIKDFSDYSGDMSKEELIEKVRGTSMNYDVPMTDKQLRAKSMQWLRNAYNNIVATHNLVNIMDVHGDDLGIVDTDKYEYCMTYSFPCQDLSLAGNRLGMDVSQKDGGTRSGLLWEVMRILKELHDSGKSLPQTLLMENVPEIIGQANIANFNKFERFLMRLGYRSYVKILNAKDFGIPQNRRRCFMVSVLGDFAYTFPDGFERKRDLRDLLDETVDPRYFLSDDAIRRISCWNAQQKPLESMERNVDVAPTLTTRSGAECAGMVLVDTSTIFNKESRGRFIGTITKSGDYGEKRKTQFNPDKECASTLRTTIMSEGGELLVFDGGKDEHDGIPVVNKSKKGYLIAREGDCVDISGRVDYHKGTVCRKVAKTLTTMGGHDVGVVVNVGNDTTIKTDFCNRLLDSGRVKEYSCIKRCSGENGEWGKSVEDTDINDSGICYALTTRCDMIGVAVKDVRGFSDTEKKLFTEDGNIRRYIGSDKVDEFKEGQMATTTYPNGYGHGPRTHDESIALNTIDKPCVKTALGIRKLIPKETMRLMGFQDADYVAMDSIGMSDMAIYHIAGDSIVVTVLMAIFSEMLGIDYRCRIESYLEKQMEGI